MNINELTIGQIKEIQKMACCIQAKPETAVAPFVAGENYLVE